MRRFLVSLVGNSFALWLTTLIVSGVALVPYADTTFATVASYVMVALIFGIVNGILGTAIRVVAFPLYILTLGILSLFVNGFLLLVVSWITDFLHFGLHIEDFGWAILGAFVLTILSAIINAILRPLGGRR
jgi:putative membrane protein